MRYIAAAPTVTDLGEGYSRADIRDTVSLFSSLAIERTLSQKLKDSCQLIQLKLARGLNENQNLYSMKYSLSG